MYYNHSSQYWAAQPGLLEQASLEPRGTLTAKSALQCWQPKKLSKKKSSRSEMWWGVLIGLFGLGAGFFGLRKVFTTDGRITEHNRQKRYAEMLTREIAKKDKATDAQTNQKINASGVYYTPQEEKDRRSRTVILIENEGGTMVRNWRLRQPCLLLSLLSPRSVRLWRPQRNDSLRS